MSPSDEPTRRPARSSTEKRAHRMSEYDPNVPPQILSQAGDAAAAAATTDGYRERPNPEQDDLDIDPPVEEVPPPPYSAAQYGQIDIQEKGIDTGARVARDGRVEIKISSKNRKLASLLRHQLDLGRQDVPPPEPDIPEGLGFISGLPPPPMNVVIHIVGSRGDVQPFIALGQVLRDKYKHRVRIATHPVFKDFVIENGLEFFSIGGDPAELMAFMVKNPGLMPGIEAIRSGDIGRRRKGIYEMINGCWRSCIEPGDGSGPPASDEMLERESIDSGISMGDPNQKPFVADAIIANPPSFAHIHIAEKLGVPLHLMFTMPWSPTQSFPHPLANIVSSNADAAMTNFLSYILVDLLTWQGIGDVINRFREKTLRLEPLSVIWAPGNLHRLRIPWTYCWSPALIPKPGDWMSNIDISGFYFLNQATNYVPPPDLDEFLNAGPPPVYIGFGSIVVDDPNAMTKLIFEAVEKTGQRALVSKGWGGLSADEMGVPEGVFLLGNCPHDWLFKKVSCVVHHGGAGTTATGIAAGRPTVIVPFFGDQQFWGHMCHRAGAGPLPIPHKELTSDNLAEAIKFVLKPETLERAQEMSDKIKEEKGTDSGADSFHRHLNVSKMRCSVCPERVAVWRYKRSGLRLSALAATVLANEGLIDFADLRLYRSRDYVPDTGPPEPISGGTAALLGSIGSVTAGIADYPAEILKSFKKGSVKPQPQRESSHDDGSPGPSKPSSVSAPESKSAHESTISLPDVPELASPMESGLSYETSSSPTRSDTIFSGISRSESASVTELPGTPSESNLTVTDADKDLESGVSSPSRARSPSVNIAGRSSSTLSLEPDADPRSSRIPLTSRGSSYSKTPQSPERSQGFGRAGQITMDSMIGTARATGNIVAAGMKSPLDFTMSIAQGLHNAPKLIGDKTVRPPEKVTGFHSGLKAAGREFFYQSYDGIAGFVTQPYQGAKEEGFAGFSKGLIRGSFGLIIKPGAAMWGLPGYAMKGIYAEIVKNFGKSTANFIIAARTAQGYDDWKASNDSDREKIIAKWKSDIMQAKASSKWWGTHWKIAESNNRRFYDDEGQLLKGWRATRHLSINDRRELDKLRKEARMKEKLFKGKAPVLSPTSPSTESLNEYSGATGEEFEQAIRTAVQRTSTNDSEEDDRIERAIRASVLEFQRTMSVRTTGREGVQDEDEDDEDEDEDEAYNKAVSASIAEYQRSRPQTAVADYGTIEATLETREHDEEFTRALQASLEESRRATARQENPNSDTEDDEEYHKAIQASMTDRVSRSRREEDEAYRRAIEESKHEHIASSPLHHSAAAFPAFRDSPPVYELPAELPGSTFYNQSRSRGVTLPVRPKTIAVAGSEAEARPRAPTAEPPTLPRPRSMAADTTPSTHVPAAMSAVVTEPVNSTESEDRDTVTDSAPETQATPVDTPTSETAAAQDSDEAITQASVLEPHDSTAEIAMSATSGHDGHWGDEDNAVSAAVVERAAVVEQSTAAVSKSDRTQHEQISAIGATSEPQTTATQLPTPAVQVHSSAIEDETASAAVVVGTQTAVEEPPIVIPTPASSSISATAPVSAPHAGSTTAPPAYEGISVIKDANEDSDGEFERILKASEEEHKNQNNDEELERALKASEEEAELEKQRTQEAGPDSEDKDDEEELQRILRASEEEAKQRELELERQHAEENIVLEYIKRQSLAEEEYRKRMQGGT